MHPRPTHQQVVQEGTLQVPKNRGFPQMSSDQRPTCLRQIDGSRGFATTSN
jgi:hypothetical protein